MLQSENGYALKVILSLKFNERVVLDKILARARWGQNFYV